MDILHLSYADVLHNIPYRNLVIMQKDKLHELSGEEEDVVTYKSARDNPKFNKMVK